MPQLGLLTPAIVGFYAGLNLLAWFMVFSFVRETKQLTLEELDRKWHPIRMICIADISCRGFLRPHQEVHPLRIDRVASLLVQALHLPPGRRQTTPHHREG